MKAYQSVLLAASWPRAITNLQRIFRDGFWFCFDCEARCERIEGENGQPHSCDRCGSSRIEYVPPAWLIEPGDLSPKEAA
jgi:hypothetical protein